MNSKGSPHLSFPHPMPHLPHPSNLEEKSSDWGRKESEPESPPCRTPSGKERDWEGAVAAASHSGSEVVRAPGPVPAQSRFSPAAGSAP